MPLPDGTRSIQRIAAITDSVTRVKEFATLLEYTLKRIGSPESSRDWTLRDLVDASNLPRRRRRSIHHAITVRNNLTHADRSPDPHEVEQSSLAFERALEYLVEHLPRSRLANLLFSGSDALWDEVMGINDAILICPRCFTPWEPWEQVCWDKDLKRFEGECSCGADLSDEISDELEHTCSSCHHMRIRRCVGCRRCNRCAELGPTNECVSCTNERSSVPYTMEINERRQGAGNLLGFLIKVSGPKVPPFLWIGCLLRNKEGEQVRLWSQVSSGEAQQIRVPLKNSGQNTVIWAISDISGGRLNFADDSRPNRFSGDVKFDLWRGETGGFLTMTAWLPWELDEYWPEDYDRVEALDELMAGFNPPPPSPSKAQR